MKYVIIGSTVKSLDMQVANFRWLLGIDGPQLTDASLAMRGVVINFDNRTKTQVKSIVLDYIRGLSRVQDYFESIKQQKEIKASVASTNEQLEINFQKNLSMASRGKNLIPKR